jgi:hypothetical protein
MNAQYEWIKFYEAAVLETDPESLPRRIEAAQYAIGQRVMKFNVMIPNDGRSSER